VRLARETNTAVRSSDFSNLRRRRRPRRGREYREKCTLLSGGGEGAAEKGLEKVLSLAQGLALNRTQALHSLHQGRKLLLERERGHRNRKLRKPTHANPRSRLAMHHAGNKVQSAWHVQKTTDILRDRFAGVQPRAIP